MDIFSPESVTGGAEPVCNEPIVPLVLVGGSDGDDGGADADGGVLWQADSVRLILEGWQ